MLPFVASRGGHAPGHIRTSFTDLLDEVSRGGWQVFEGQGHLLGQLYNCTDILPGSDCDFLDIPTGSTYAQAVRNLKSRLSDLGVTV